MLFLVIWTIETTTPEKGTTDSKVESYSNTNSIPLAPPSGQVEFRVNNSINYCSTINVSQKGFHKK